MMSERRRITRKRYGHNEVRAWKRNNEKWFNRNADKEANIKRCGYVYIFKLYDNYYKVGQTVNIQDRAKALRASCPTLVCVFSAHVKDRFEVEKLLHKKFKRQRVEREVFVLHQEDIRWADKLADRYRG